MERTNARYLDSLPEPIDIVTVDVSFISLNLILPQAVGWLRPAGEIVALIKPQFEAGPQDVEKGGVVRDPTVHRRVLEKVLEDAAELELGLRGAMPSPLQGPAGNIEFLAWWRLGAEAIDRASAITACLAEAA
jgi:23S rRNA (cytidine1920-2'-O)/16S rRNA (cytidine1409-2'-O)-methyltransferase